MGSALYRNRFWYYRSFYDDYAGREFRLAFGMAAFLWIPHYYWGIHINRELEVHFSHRNYSLEFGPRRNRLAHSMLFEEFDLVLEKWEKMQEEYKEKGAKMLEEQK